MSTTLDVRRLDDHAFPVPGPFACQRLADEELRDAFRANLAADVAAGSAHHVRAALGDLSSEDAAVVERELAWLEGLGKDRVRALARRTRGQRIRMCSLMLGGRCDASCGVCYTDRRLDPGTLSWSQRRELLEGLLPLGLRLVYVPGRGEPLLDPDVWSLVDWCEERGVDLVLFTNGLLLGDDERARRAWGIDAGEVAGRLRAARRTHVYVKLWSLRPAKAAWLLGVPEVSYRSVRLADRSVALPAGLVRLLEVMPRDRVGAEVLLERRNQAEVEREILPLVAELGIALFLERPMHTGRAAGRFDLDPDPAVVERLRPWLKREDCRRLVASVAVHDNGAPSFCLGYRPEGAEAFAPGDLVGRLHADPLLVRSRYHRGGCLCERRAAEAPRARPGGRALLPIRPGAIAR